MWLLIPILIYSLVFLYVRHIFIYWQRNRFPCEKSGLSARFLHRIYRRQFHLADAVSDAYRQTRERFLGIYMFFRPTLLVRDVELARDILANTDRCFHEPKWQYSQAYRRINLLEKIRPAFARQLCREMFPSVVKVGDNMLRHLAETWAEDKESLDIDMEAILRTFSNDIIGNLVYGLKIDSFRFPENVFNQHLARLRRKGFPPVITLMNLAIRKKHAIGLRSLLRETVRHRELQNIVRKDILQVLIRMRNAQSVGDELVDVWNVDLVPDCEKSFSLEAIEKVAEQLMEVGLEPIASTAVFTLFEVMQQPAILGKIRHEIETTLRRHHLSGEEELSYDTLEDMTYLDLCVKETLRKYPGHPVIRRVCSKSYRIPGTRHDIQRGCIVLIPVRDIQRDDQHFPEPLLYKPERFLIPSHNRAYLPFGYGPRSCIAQSLANVVVKVALTKLLLRFHLQPAQPAYTDAVKKCAKVNLKRRKPQ